MTVNGESERSTRILCSGSLFARCLSARRFWLWAFLGYAVLLFTLTHWPNLTIESEIVERPDLFIHLAAFGGWTGLLAMSGLAGTVGEWWPTLLRTAVLGAIYAAIDEGLQAVPFVSRHCAWDDLFANWGGVAIGTLCAAGVFATLKHCVPARLPKLGGMK